ncbi:D-alanyl-D-alanine carboxypeptidase/D-alanyl-D-alanine endopeptidase [Flavihumibacter fluvii]|uniref:D-alanyl-D-alanine carboxypeptidase/D-alanyl-D-alanine endopeptidase n=1 Tax=Flavihumibacter fluvii TaxID=2838157 RepID=UPI001BDEC9C4|nr:D-alanyl-D-alanine carboxypeptidase/D-alanyl-D-alanine-endopeptidase [Flavihumibacter fluvii]ULQ52300.1 D-alanyl-D-alanine carboxypeptidase/D-alanyl-D-alanine-endopeptidase [Flavihumibacter fluvii]
MRSTCIKTGLPALYVLLLFSCSPARQISRSAQSTLLDKPGLKEAHIGISIFDADKATFLYNYQAEKYFVPASNAKLFTLYAALHYLGDSLPGIRYAETPDSIYLLPAGDPTFLHPDFMHQPVFDWLKKTHKELVISDGNWQEKQLGFGWSWDDYNSGYMAERSSLPVYGNVIKWTQVIEKTENPEGKMVDDAFVYSEPEVSWKLQFNPVKGNNFIVVRDQHDNIFHVTEGKEILRTIEVPFVTNGVLSAIDLLRDTLQKSIIYIPQNKSRQADHILYSQPLDSMLYRMMHRSDNLYAEQTLLMVSQKVLGVMNTEHIIDSLMKKDLAGINQLPNWVDGSGLSRYNLFTPRNFIWVLQAMQKEYPTTRLELILSGANKGTLAGYYKGLEGAIFAKTGTLSGQVALSGYLKTKNGKRLIFSILVNNHQTSTTTVRRSIENFLVGLYNKY